MLKVLAVASPESPPGQLELSYYIPFKVRYPSRPYHVPVYWRTGNFKRSLIEVGLDPQTGRFVSTTITLVPRSWVLPCTSAPEPTPAEPGVPVLDISVLHGVYTDDPASFRLHVGENFLWLDLSLGAQPVRELVHHGLRFLIGADDTWIGLVAQGVTEDGLKELQEGVAAGLDVGE